MISPKLFLSAGDLSGDTAAVRVLTSLKSTHPDLQCTGLGGPRLKAEGQLQLAAFRDLAVMGFWEVARRFSFFRRLMRECVEEIARSKPAVVVLVDYPGFNLRLAERIKPLGIPIVYYISPQVWAWGKGRLKQIQRLVDRMLVILPFEETFYRQQEVPCDFVGHYLLEDIPREFISSPPPGKKQLALLPGSRPQEIERMLPPMIQAARKLCKERQMTAVVAGVEGAFDYESLVGQSADISVVYNQSRQVVHDSDVVLVTSGTATLETGIIGRPMVVAYKTGWITYQIARRLVKLDHIALVNLVLDGDVVPELIQGNASPERMAAEITSLLNDKGRYDSMRSRLNTLPEALGGTGSGTRAAEIIGEYLN